MSNILAKFLVIGDVTISHDDAEVGAPWDVLEGEGMFGVVGSTSVVVSWISTYSEYVLAAKTENMEGFIAKRVKRNFLHFKGRSLPYNTK